MPRTTRLQGQEVSNNITLIRNELARARSAREQARVQYIDAVEWLARNLIEAAAHAKTGVGRPMEARCSTTVMTSSLVDTIPALAYAYEHAGEMVKTFENILKEWED